VERAQAAGVPVIEASGHGLETMWRRVLEVVLDAVGAATDATGAGSANLSTLPDPGSDGSEKGLAR
jgi:hypothetical protein